MNRKGILFKIVGRTTDTIVKCGGQEFFGKQKSFFRVDDTSRKRHGTSIQRVREGVSMGLLLFMLLERERERAICYQLLMPSCTPQQSWRDLEDNDFAANKRLLHKKISSSGCCCM